MCEGRKITSCVDRFEHIISVGGGIAGWAFHKEGLKGGRCLRQTLTDEEQKAVDGCSWKTGQRRKKKQFPSKISSWGLSVNLE